MPHSPRAELRAVECDNTDDGRLSVTVKLGRRLGGSLFQTFVGKTDGDPTESGMIQCGAHATLLALERAYKMPAGVLVIEGIKQVESFDRNAILVRLSGLHEGQSLDFVGFCEVAGDPASSAAKAVLSALNRFVGYAFP